MKKIIVFIFVSISVTTFAQKNKSLKADTVKTKKDSLLVFTESEKLEYEDYRFHLLRVQKQNKEFQKIDSVHQVSLHRTVRASKIDPSRISINGDSVKITENGILFILRDPKRKKK
jgi:hypothetical protein